MATTQGPAYTDALVANLRLRAGLANVHVLAGPPGDDNIPSEAIAFSDVEWDTEWAALGGLRQDEVFEIRGAILAFFDGATDLDAVAARDRAYALLAEVENELRSSPQQGLPLRVIESRVSRGRFVHGIQPSKRWAGIEFYVRVRARI